MRRISPFLIAVILFAGGPLPPAPAAQQGDTAPPAARAGAPTLAEAVMCEALRDDRPVGRAVVFSLSLGEVYCYTAFDPVPENTVVFHDWYRKDVLASKVKLKLFPPRWSTISRIQLREADKGPWRVEVTDELGRVYRILRFSITD